MDLPKTLQQAILYFSDYENCREFMMALRWPNGVVQCPTCGSEHVTYLEKARLWKCYAKHAKPKFSLKTGTIFEDSPIGLDKWLAAVWMVVNCRNGVSSYEIGRDLGVTQKTAWFMGHRIRLALQMGTFGKLSGEVEVDETYIGGKARNMHASRKRSKLKGLGGGSGGKVAVQGILQRDGEVRVHVVGDTKYKSLVPNIKKHVEAGSHLFTDDAVVYFGLSDEYVHDFINHAETYVRDNVHTNGLENFWSLLKRGLHGTYVSVEPYHLFRYIDEQAYRYNHRTEMNDLDRFALAMSNITDKRLTYRKLTGKDPDYKACSHWQRSQA